MPTSAARSCTGAPGRRVDGLGDHLDVLQPNRVGIGTRAHVRTALPVSSLGGGRDSGCVVSAAEQENRRWVIRFRACSVRGPAVPAGSCTGLGC